MHRTWFWLILWLLPAVVQGQDVFTLTAESLQNGQAVELDKLGWKYSPNDDPRFADPQFDDRAWETLNGTAITLNSIPKSGWRGLGWFRLRLKADPALANQPLALVMVHYGASEIYLDGKLIEPFGTVGATPETEIEYNPNTVPLGLVLDRRSEHVIAVRHSCLAMRDATSWRSRWLHRLASRQILKTYTNRTSEFGAGFGIGMQELKQGQAKNERRKSLAMGFGLYFCGLALAIGLVHLLLYWLYPSQRANLFFGSFACCVSIAYTAQFLLLIGHSGANGILSLYVINNFSLNLAMVSFLAFFYTVFLFRLPKLFWLWLVAAVSFLFIVLLNLLQEGGLIFSALALVAVLRVVIQAIRNRVDGAWILGISLLLCTTTGVISGFYESAGAIPPLTLGIIAAFSLVLPPSIFLARRFARTSLNLEEQLIQVKQLSAAALEHEKVKAEHDRKTKELEEARQLQLSMLPKKLPQLPRLDIAAYMKTASEVGGDYYDFHLSDDGTLTIAVGDATGHGLKAGTMVASVKSLFMTLAYHPDIPHIFTRLSQTLKGMNLRGLFMAMTIAKVKENRLTISIAGMPPAWIYRAREQQIEEVALQQLPLGGVTKYAYQQREYDLASGDVVVLLSDGLPERFNEQGAMLEDETAKEFITANAHLSVQDLINGLAKLGDDWGGARPQDDDVTLVVLKIR
ncbi:MAG: SpoIIE family protein phosphatase [Blastocatellia bacterium]|nr:SpoIIE family protein phosphatase [Blastocatellia bacterium]